LRQLVRIRNALRELGIATDGKASARSAGGRGRRKGTGGRLEQIRSVLREAGRMMTAAEIRDALVEQDPSANWKQPGNVMRSLTRNQEQGPDEIIRPETGLYTLRQLEEALKRPEPKEPQPRGAITVRKTKGDILKDILREAGRPLHYKEIHAEMARRVPDLAWNHPSESVRQIVGRSHGAIVNAGPGKWTLSNQQRTEESEQAASHI